MRGYHFADSLARGGACIDGAADGGDVTTNNRGDQAGIDLFPADKTNIRGLHHRVCSFNHRGPGRDIQSFRALHVPFDRFLWALRLIGFGADYQF